MPRTPVEEGEVEVVTGESAPPCRFFNAGGCRYGEACMYSHVRWEGAGGGGRRGQVDASERGGAALADPHLGTRDQSDVALCDCGEVQPVSFVRESEGREKEGGVALAVLYGVRREHLLANLGAPPRCSSEMATDVAEQFRTGRVVVRGGQTAQRRSKKKRGLRVRGTKETSEDDGALSYVFPHCKTPLRLQAVEAGGASVARPAAAQCVWQVSVSREHARCQLAWLERCFGVLCAAADANGGIHYAPYEAGQPLPPPLTLRLAGSAILRHAQRKGLGTGAGGADDNQCGVSERGSVAGRVAPRIEVAVTALAVDTAVNESALALALRYCADESFLSVPRLSDSLGGGEAVVLMDVEEERNFRSAKEACDQEEDDSDSREEEEDEDDDVMNDRAFAATAAAQTRLAAAVASGDVRGVRCGADWSLMARHEDIERLRDARHRAAASGSEGDGASGERVSQHEETAGDAAEVILVDVLAHSVLESAVEWSDVARRYLAQRSAGCSHSAQVSEAAALEVLVRLLGGVRRCWAEMEVQYGRANDPKADFVYEHANGRVGVSVTRACDGFSFALDRAPPRYDGEQRRHAAFTGRRARALLLRKTQSIERARECVQAQHAWSRSLLFVWCSSQRAADALRAAWPRVHEEEGRPPVLLVAACARFGPMMLSRSFLFS